MSHDDGLYIVLKDEKYQKTIFDILTKQIDPDARVVYLANSENDVNVGKKLLESENNYVTVINTEHTFDEISDSSAYSRIALEVFRLSADVIITGTLENNPYEIMGIRDGIPAIHPYIVGSGSNDDMCYPLDALINLSLRGTIVIIGVDAPDMNVAQQMVYDEAHKLGKNMLVDSYSFGKNVFSDEKFGYWS